VEALDGHDWSLQRTNLLLSEFGLPSLDARWDGPSFADLKSGVSDAALVEMYALVMGMEVREAEEAVESTSDDRNWKTGYVRLFLSHSAIHKEFVGEVARELAVVGIHGFVAHDTMEHSRPWQLQIEQALRSMQVFVALVHPEFNESGWCQQEVGWSMGRRVPRFAVRLGADPAAFLGSDQWPSERDALPEQVAGLISSWVAGLPELGPAVVDGLLRALETAGNYVDAGAAADRLVALRGLNDEQFERLNKAWWSNDQLFRGYLPTQALRPFYGSNGRTCLRPRRHRKTMRWRTTMSPSDGSLRSIRSPGGRLRSGIDSELMGRDRYACETAPIDEPSLADV